MSKRKNKFRARLVLTERQAKIVWHAYILRCHLEIVWPPIIDGVSIYHDLKPVIDHYFKETGIKNIQCPVARDWSDDDNEYIISEILDEWRDQSKSSMKKRLRAVFPEIFKRGNGQLPLVVPDILQDKVTIDKKLIMKLCDTIGKVRKKFEGEKEMTETTGIQKTESKRSVLIPKGIDVDTLTLANFKELTGKRFRLTKAQKARVDAKEITREQAFQESKESGFTI